MAKVVLLRAIDDHSETVELLEWREVLDEPKVPDADYVVRGRRYPVTSFARHDKGLYVVLSRHPIG